MKWALIFLSAFVAISHQQYFQPRMMFGFPWMSPFAQQAVGSVNDYNEEVLYPGVIGLNSRNGNDQNDEFNDIQSRIKGFSNHFNGLSRYRPNPSLNDQQQNARFFFNWANTGNNANNNNNNFNNFNNPFFKTVTFTLTSTLTLASIQSCVPSNNFLSSAVPAPVACRRKRSGSSDSDDAEDQFPITPSETLSVTPTALSSPEGRSLDVLLSSREDSLDQLSTNGHRLREKRFFYPNKNLFIVSSTITSYAFVNTTITVTVNLLPPADAAAGACSAVGPPVPPAAVCVACLPAGFILCPLAG